MASIEFQLNNLDVEAGKVESESLIESCFELGFFPWDNPKFLVFLHWYLQCNLSSLRGDHRFMRGLICARHLQVIMPAGIDSDIYQDINDWANLKLSDRLGAARCVWPAAPMQRGFGIRMQRYMDSQYMQPVRLKQKLRLRQQRQQRRSA